MSTAVKYGSYSHLIGVSYDTLNCWQLCQKFYSSVLSINLSDYFFDPNYTEDKNYVNSLIRANDQDFHKVKSPQFGDLITLRIRGIECHIAVYVGNGLILHTQKKTGSVIDRLSRWQPFVAGYYSIKKESP